MFRGFRKTFLQMFYSCALAAERPVGVGGRRRPWSAALAPQDTILRGRRPQISVLGVPEDRDGQD